MTTSAQLQASVRRSISARAACSGEQYRGVIPLYVLPESACDPWVSAVSAGSDTE